MENELKKFLYDIKTAIDSIYEYLEGKNSFDQYKTNKLLRRAIERELEIIGEAANQIPKIDSKIEITNTRRIIDLRNLIIHAYDNIDDIIVWGILTKDIPKLKDHVRQLLGA